jgi:hypothetical protein
VYQHFKELNLDIRVLSVFEANKSRVRDGLLKSIRSTSHQIVSPLKQKLQERLLRLNFS